MTMTFDQRRFIEDIEERVGTIRRQADAVLKKAEGSDLYAELRPMLEGIATNTAHVLNDVGLLRKTVEG